MGSLSVMWKSNPKAWLTEAIFQDYFFHYFILEEEKYYLKKDIWFNILLLLDNAQGHFPFMDNFHPNINVVHLPPNTMLLIQPMDQKVISTFKKYYLHHDKSGTMLQHFWMDYNIYKTIDCLVWGYGCHYEWGLEEPLPAVCSQFSWIWEGGQRVQRSLQQLSDLQWEVGARSSRGWLHCTPCCATWGAY